MKAPDIDSVSSSLFWKISQALLEGNVLCSKRFGESLDNPTTQASSFQGWWKVISISVGSTRGL